MQLQITHLLLAGAISSLSLLGAAEPYPQSDYLTGDWNGARSALGESGVHLGLSYTTEPAVLLSGSTLDG